MDLAPTRNYQGKRALEHIRLRLLSGAYRPGDTLPIDPLAAEVGVSRQTILEAMRVLAARGLVTIIPQVGCQAARHSIADIADFFTLFATVEGLLARLAAERAFPHDLERLKWLSHQIGRLRQEAETVEARAAGHRRHNRLFHAELHRLAAAPEIAALAEGFWDRSEFHIVTAVQTELFSLRLEDAYDEHEIVLACIETGQAAEAERMMRRHIEAFRDAVVTAGGVATAARRNEPATITT